MDIRPLRTEADYLAALAEISPMFDSEPEPGTPEGDRFEVMVTLIEAYERQHYPVAPPDPIEAIKFRMEQAGMSVADLKPYIGPPNRVYEVLSRRRGLSLAMIRRLHDGLGISADALIAPVRGGESRPPIA
ncbi:helix-turn-helix domain-containing protein [Thauera butanivorans]|uniref:helix-turn-helix domain-containing protein n=1 Tax=Thauera butanivorans TaxID=86174 RepID=UPI003AB24848